MADTIELGKIHVYHICITIGPFEMLIQLTEPEIIKIVSMDNGKPNCLFRSNGATYNLISKLSWSTFLFFEWCILGYGTGAFTSGLFVIVAIAIALCALLCET